MNDLQDDPAARLERIRAAWPLPDSERLRDDVMEAYGELHRYYHDVRHLDEVLERVREIAAAATDLDLDEPAVVLAAFFHDVIYATPGDGDPERNEERSAAYARHALEGVAASHLVAEVERLVRGTATHESAAGDVNAAVLFDADLAILAAERERYDEYVRQVRAEYAHVGDADFARGRAAIMQALLDQPFLFATDYARDRWETAARSNVTHELANPVG